MLFFRRARMAYVLTKILRKESDIPAGGRLRPGGKKAFSGSMTVEAAVCLPWFLFAMLAVMQFFKISMVSLAVLTAMHDTAKNMAAYAYISQLGVSAGEGIGAELLEGGISAAYAMARVESRASFDPDDGTLQYWRSSFTQDDIIDLAVLYEAKNTYTPLPVPKVRAALRARVRAWTGRDGDGSSQGEEQGEEEKNEHVFVAETGHVYHKDPACTHIRLSIKTLPRSSLSGARNKSGGKYHACERCGGGTGDNVYVTDYGDRYHSSLTCSGLKRTVKSVPLSELEGWRACSRCGG